MSNLIPGKYQLMKSEKWDEYLKALGVKMPVPGAYNSSVFEIERKESEWHLKLSFGPKTTEATFKLGVPFEDVTFDGRKCQSLINIDDKDQNRMIQTQKFSGGKELQTIREFQCESLKITMPYQDLVCVLLYKRVTSVYV